MEELFSEVLVPICFSKNMERPQFLESSFSQIFRDNSYSINTQLSSCAKIYFLEQASPYSSITVRDQKKI